MQAAFCTAKTLCAPRPLSRLIRTGPQAPGQVRSGRQQGNSRATARASAGATKAGGLCGGKRCPPPERRQPQSCLDQAARGETDRRCSSLIGECQDTVPRQRAKTLCNVCFWPSRYVQPAGKVMHWGSRVAMGERIPTERPSPAREKNHKWFLPGRLKCHPPPSGPADQRG